MKIVYATFFNGINPKQIQIDEKSYKNILIYYIEYVTVKGVSYAAINSANPLHVLINKIKRFTEECNGNKYLMLVLTDESKDTLKKYEELWNTVRYLIRSIAIKLDNYDKNNAKIKLNSGDNLPIKKTLDCYNIVVVRSVFHVDNKYYQKVFLNEYLNKSKVLEYDRIDSSEVNDLK